MASRARRVERRGVTPGLTGREMVTKGNNVLASGALSAAHQENEPIARRAIIYRPERVIESDFEVVRDTEFEPVAPNREQF